MKIKSILKDLRLKNIFFLTVAGIINAIGVTIFIAPVGLYDIGISGTSILLSQLTSIPLSAFLMILNIPLFIFGLKKQGTTFTIYAIYAVLIYSLAALLIEDVLPIDVSIASPIAKNDLLLCAIFGGVISGIGSGLALRFNGVMDGVEVASLVLTKKLGISVTSFVMIYNIALYVVCGIVIKSWILPLYSIVMYAVSSKVIDYIIEGIDGSKAATIITDKPTEVGKEISNTFKCGITVTEAKGFYSNQKKTVLYVVINKFQIPRLKDIVKEIDATAYVSINDIADVYHGSAE